MFRNPRKGGAEKEVFTFVLGGPRKKFHVGMVRDLWGPRGLGRLLGRKIALFKQYQDGLLDVRGGFSKRVISCWSPIGGRKLELTRSFLWGLGQFS